MSNGTQKIFTVGVKLKSGDWQIKSVNVTLDPGNHFRPVWPVNLEWPDGIIGTFFKESISGKCFYKEA